MAHRDHRVRVWVAYLVLVALLPGWAVVEKSFWLGDPGISSNLLSLRTVMKIMN